MGIEDSNHTQKLYLITCTTLYNEPWLPYILVLLWRIFHISVRSLLNQQNETESKRLLVRNVVGTV
jgi:hypothetical protein